MPATVRGPPLRRRAPAPTGAPRVPQGRDGGRRRSAGHGRSLRVIRALNTWIGRVELSDESFATRHRVLLSVLWGTLVLDVAVAVIHQPGADHVHGATSPRTTTTIVWAFIGATALCALV